jgi:hypothetical protein
VVLRYFCQRLRGSAGSADRKMRLAANLPSETCPATFLIPDAFLVSAKVHVIEMSHAVTRSNSMLETIIMYAQWSTDSIDALVLDVYHNQFV